MVVLILLVILVYSTFLYNVEQRQKSSSLASFEAASGEFY